MNKNRIYPSRPVHIEQKRIKSKNKSEEIREKISHIKKIFAFAFTFARCERTFRGCPRRVSSVSVNIIHYKLLVYGDTCHDAWSITMYSNGTLPLDAPLDARCVYTLTQDIFITMMIYKISQETSKGDLIRHLTQTQHIRTLRCKFHWRIQCGVTGCARFTEILTVFKWTHKNLEFRRHRMWSLNRQLQC